MHLLTLLERGFSIPDAAQILGISVPTTERRLQEFGISSTQFFMVIDDQTLDCTIEDILRNFSFKCLQLNDWCSFKQRCKSLAVSDQEVHETSLPRGGSTLGLKSEQCLQKELQGVFTAWPLAY